MFFKKLASIIVFLCILVMLISHSYDCLYLVIRLYTAKINRAATVCFMMLIIQYYFLLLSQISTYLQCTYPFCPSQNILFSTESIMQGWVIQKVNNNNLISHLHSSCFSIRNCKAMAASTLTGGSLSSVKQSRAELTAISRFLSSLNVMSPKLCNTQQA